jgi:hypothetical protein
MYTSGSSCIFSSCTTSVRTSGLMASKTEMDLEHVEPLVIVADPTRFEHQRRPPAARHGPTVRWHRIVKAHNGTAPIGLGQVSNVDVRGGHRGDAQRQAPRIGHQACSRGLCTIWVRGQDVRLAPERQLPPVLKDAADRCYPLGAG